MDTCTWVLSNISGYLLFVILQEETPKEEDDEEKIEEVKDEEETKEKKKKKVAPCLTFRLLCNTCIGVRQLSLTQSACACWG